jgi:tRNA-dihydrouridine synthase B
MIGRAALGNPFVFEGIKKFSVGEKVSEITLADKFAAAKKHIAYFEEFYGENAILGEMKKHLAWYVKGFANSASLRAEIVKCRTISEAAKIINMFN